MARRGVWELQELLIKYSLDGGSSCGVREFVEQGLVSFAQRNPQISIATQLRAGHPTVEGKYSASSPPSRALPAFAAGGD